MGLHEAFTQKNSDSKPSVSALISLLIPATPTVALPGRDRRYFTIANTGSIPIIFGYGECSPATYTAEINPGGIWIDDTGWSGEVLAISRGDGAATISITEIF